MAEEKISPEPTLEPQPAVEPVSESEIPSKPNINRLKAILFSVLGIVFMGGLVFAGYKFGQKQIQSGTVGPTPTPVAVATPTPDPTANWKPYANTDFGIKLKFPQDFQIQEKDNLISIFSKPSICETDESGEKVKIEASELKINIISHKGLNYKTVWKNVFGSGFKEGSYDELKTIGGKQSFTLFSGAESSFSMERNIIEVSSKDTLEINIYRPLLISNCDTELNKFSPGMTDLILSTFKFLPSANSGQGEKTFCDEPRPEVCTTECINPPPYICGSNGKLYCNKCAACADLKVDWYIIQSEPCGI